MTTTDVQADLTTLGHATVRVQMADEEARRARDWRNGIAKRLHGDGVPAPVLAETMGVSVRAVYKLLDNQAD